MVKNPLENIFPRNPTQTRFRRFKKVPWGDWNTEFDKVRRNMEKVRKSVIDEHIGELK